MAAWVAKYDAAGHMLWKRELGTESSFESASGVATDAAGNVYLTGTTDGSLGGANRGNTDAWVAKYSTRR
jgi:Beta-propeller repeat